MIKPEFGLFQVQQEGVFGHALELLEAGFGKAPQGLDAVAVRGPLHELVPAVADAKAAGGVGATRLAATDSPTGEGSTMGAPGLNGSVRNGKR